MMLNKLTSIPTLCRLTLCLMASAAVHGGLAFYEGTSHPATVRAGRSAVAVALVPGAGESFFNVADAPNNFTQQAATVTEPPAIDRKPLPAADSLQEVNSSRAIPLNNGFAGQLTEVVEDSADDIVSPESACLEPCQSWPGHQAEVDSKTDEAVAGLQGELDDGFAELALPGTSDMGQEAPGEDALNQVAGPQEVPLIEAMPNYRYNPLPEYPLIARQRQWQGVVWLLVDVSATGLVDDVDLEQSCGYRVLDKAASRAVQRWEFTPAKRAGLPVASQVRIPIRFSLEGS